MLERRSVEVVGVDLPLRIEEARPEDAPGIAGLIDEIDRYYGGHGVTLSKVVREVEDEVFGARPAGHVVVARRGRVVGMAAYSFLWPANGAARSIFLKELFVSEPFRRRGVGRALMAHVHEVAIARGCCRIDWTGERGDAGAAAFYASLDDGSALEPNKVFYRMPLR